MSSDSIMITNYSDQEMEIISTSDSSVVESDRKKVITLQPKESFVLFTDRLEAISWQKKK